MDEALRQIDNEIAGLVKLREKYEEEFRPKINDIISGLNKAKKIIMVEQKSDVCDINVGNIKTKGDVIRETNENLIDAIIPGSLCNICKYKYDEDCDHKDCKSGILAYLNTKAEGE